MNRLICKYFDNLFDVISSHETETASIKIDPIISVLKSLRFIVNYKKNEDETKLSFTKIELNTVKMKTRLSSDKYQHILHFIQYLLKHEKSSFKKLEKAMGFLSFYAWIMKLRHPFLRNIFNQLRWLECNLWYIYYLSDSIYRDLAWWALFLNSWIEV